MPVIIHEFKMSLNLLFDSVNNGIPFLCLTIQLKDMSNDDVHSNLNKKQ